VRKANIFAWRIHPNKIDDDDDFPAIKQEFVTYDDLLERQAEAEKYGFTKFDNIEKLEQDKFNIKEEDLKRLQKEGDYIDKDNPRIELLHYWGLYSDSANVQKKPMWIIVANRKYILRKQDNPYWHKKPPLFHIVWTEDERPSYYGIGLCEIGADAEDRANTNVNIRIDERKKSLRGGGVYNRLDKKIKKSELQQNIPGLWRGASDINNIKPDLPIPKSTLDDYKEEEVAVNDHREITGASSALLPTENPRNRPDTLGGMQQELGQAVAKLKPDLSMMEIMGIRKIADRALLLTRQFMTKEETIEIIASESQLKQFNIAKIYTMTPEQLMGSVRFFCTGLSESLDKMQNIDKALKFMEILQKTAPGHPFVNFLIKKIAFWLGFEDAGEFFDNMPMLPAMPPGLPPGLPPGAQGGAIIPGGIPMPVPPGMPPPGGNGGRLSPELLAMIAQNIARGGQPVNQPGMI
jgi:hypothetical protein